MKYRRNPQLNAKIDLNLFSQHKKEHGHKVNKKLESVSCTNWKPFR